MDRARYMLRLAGEIGLVSTSREYYPATHAQQNPHKPAIVMGATGEVVTYAELESRSNQLAHALRDAGLQPGDNLAIFLENHARYLEVVWAAQRSGLYYTPISSLLTASELEYIVDDCRATAVIAAGEPGARRRRTRRAVPRAEVRLAIGGAIEGFDSYEEAVATRPTTPVLPEVAGIEMFYSSGTTGRPKGVRKALTLQPAWDPPGYFPTFRDLYGFDTDTVWLSTGPLYHAGPLYGCLAAMRAGATIVVMERFDPGDALRLIERYRVTHAQWVPTMFSRMLKLPGGTVARTTSRAWSSGCTAPRPARSR